MNELSGSRCLVTGGAGFIGSTIVDHLLAAGAAEVRVIDNFVRGSWLNLSEAQKHPAVQITEGDIRDSALLDRLTDGTDFVFHQAALRITRCAEYPREAVEVLIDGTMNVLESALKFKVKKVMAASSASVYGEPSYLPMDEEHPFNNRTLYGGCKIANEQMLRALNDTHGLEYIALRPFNVYGPRMDVTGAYTEVLIRWLDAIDAGKPPLIFGDGKQSMDFVYIDDVARAYIVAAQSAISDDFFNAGSGVQTSLNELCRLLLSLTGSTLEPEYREARKVGHVQRRQASMEKAGKSLGFRCEISLEEGLRRLIAWRQAAKAAVTAGAEAL
jgi:UDP-glucose 4-epimerase